MLTNQYILAGCSIVLALLGCALGVVALYYSHWIHELQLALLALERELHQRA